MTTVRKPKPKTKSLKVTKEQLGTLRWMVKEEMWNFKEDGPESYKSMGDLLTQIDTLMLDFK